MQAAARQLELLVRIQRLLRDSDYTTTYKCALLHALCDLACELGPGEREISLESLARRVLELYWQQVVPFSIGPSDETVELRQSTGRVPAILQIVTKTRKARGCNDVSFTAIDARAVTQAAARLRRYPIQLLQPRDDPFLYTLPPHGNSLLLMPDVPEVLRQFHGLITDMARARWVAMVERWTPRVSGSDALSRHLFEADRSSLRVVVEPLLELQKGRCFYTQDKIDSEGAHVDHFLPWGRTRNNSVGNLVLATAAANLKKSDRIPSVDEVTRWQVRNRVHASTLASIAERTGLLWTPRALDNLCRWLREGAA